MSKSGLKNTELLARIVGVTMLKMKPREISARERLRHGVKNAIQNKMQ
jgi:hypothetical protein